MFRTGNEKIDNKVLVIPVEGNTILHENTIAAITNDGYVIEAIKSTALKIVGRVEHYCDNSDGVAGDKNVTIKRGTFLWEQDGTIKNTDALKKCYLKDSVSVTLVSEESCIVGTILGVEADYVIVDMGDQDG